MMNRRQALVAMIHALGLAGVSSVFGVSAQADQQPTKADKWLLSDSQVRLLVEVADTILPTTENSPGARAAGIGAFFQEMVSDYYSAEEQRIFLTGLQALQNQVVAAGYQSFEAMDVAQREALLLVLEDNADATYYRMIKQLTVWGYFSSEVGVKQALRFAPIPGRYDGSVKIQPGTKAWANIGA